MKAKTQEKVKKMGYRTIGRIDRYQGITQCTLLGLKRAYIRGEADFLVFIYMGGSAFIQIETLTDEYLKKSKEDLEYDILRFLLCDEEPSDGTAQENRKVRTCKK
jgi:hypothetical protein